MSSDKLVVLIDDERIDKSSSGLQPSPSMPAFPSHDIIYDNFVIDIPNGDEKAAETRKSDTGDDEELAGIVV